MKVSDGVDGCNERAECGLKIQRSKRKIERAKKELTLGKIDTASELLRV